MFKDFPLGKAPLVMMVLFVFAASVIVLRPKDDKEGLEFWIFALSHNNDYKKRIPLFEEKHPGVKVKLRYTSTLTDRLLAAFASGFGIPDAVEVEIGAVGKFFKGDTSEYGFAVLDDFYVRQGLKDKIIPSRLTPWSYNGRIYGIPHDVHPVVYLYRHDIFEQAGVDLTQVKTWDDFIRVTKDFCRDLDGDGQIDRYALVLNTSGYDTFHLLLLQRGGGIFDEKGNITVNDEKAVETLAFMRDLVQKHKIATPNLSIGGIQMSDYAAMKEGYICGILAPDWQVAYIREFTPDLDGKWRAMPMPSVRPGGRRTSTWGGTMFAISKESGKKELAWELGKFLYLEDDAIISRFHETMIVPPFRTAWSLPVFDEPQDYFGGQIMGRLLTELADEIPPLHMNPYFAEAAFLSGDAVFNVVRGEKSPKKALDQLAAKIQEKIRADAYYKKDE
jgi:arabinosaccharide transport system substrate-binding protein